MRQSRFYDPELPDEGRFELPAEEAAHAQRALRLRPGALIEVFDGKGRLASCVIEELTRRLVRCRIQEQYPPEPQPLPAIHVAVAPPKGRRIAMLVEKLTELGVASLRPLLTERGAFKEADFESEAAAWERRSAEAAKQCKRCRLPKFEAPVVVEQLALTGPGLLGDASTKAPLLGTVVQGWSAPVTELMLAVGPEGGFTDEEQRTLSQKGFEKARLGRHVLRIETAALALVAGLLALCEPR